jgi:hypothetical protein
MGHNHILQRLQPGFTRVIMEAAKEPWLPCYACIFIDIVPAFEGKQTDIEVTRSMTLLTSLVLPTG